MRKTAAIICITLFIAVMIAIAYKASQPHQELSSPEAQLDDTLILDHSRIPEDSATLKAREAEWREGL